MKPDFSIVHPDLLHQVMESWGKKDAAGIMLMVDDHERGDLLLRNLRAFIEAGIYETALYEAYIHGPCLTPRNWKFFFRFADRAKLASHGDPIPELPSVVYRGVSNARHRKWIRGMSWTTNPSIAAWFALRWTRPGDDPAVYKVTAAPSQIFLVTNERDEEEVILDVWSCGRLTRLSELPEPHRKLDVITK